MRRIVRPEILDGDHASHQEIGKSLVDLQRINRWFGGTRTMRKLIETVLDRTNKTHLTLLDVGSATGDIPIAIEKQLASRGIQLRYTLLDRDSTHFSADVSNRVRGNALTLPFRDKSFDLISCSLFAHHLEPDELSTFLKESLRISRIAVLINDLRRSYLHLAAVRAGTPIFSRITRHDSVASVRRAYTPGEMRQMLNHGTARHIEIRNSYLFRMGIIAWK
ncbi:MAG TPA: methyltransferase domain-containing protein [Terriglobales bacterium]|nr:methyltransferase domain-containing protein [Terriglobales bacterium]